MPTATIDIASPGQDPESITLQEGTTTLGRASDSNVVLNHPNVSRNHLQIRLDSNGISVADAGSSNGTKLNDVALTPHQWQPAQEGDHIDVGPFRLTVAAVFDEMATVINDQATVHVPRMTTAPPPSPAPVQPPIQEPEPSPFVVPPRPAPEPEPVVVPPRPEPDAPPVTVPPTPPPAPPAVGMQQQASGVQQPPRPMRPPRPAAGGGSAAKASLALLLVVVAALLTLPSALAAWEQRVLMNEDAFVDAGNEALRRDPVQEELARQLTRELSLTSGSGLLNQLGIPKGIEEIIPPAVGDILGGILGLPSATPTPAPKATTPKSSGGDTVIQPIIRDLVRDIPDSPVADAALAVTHEAMVIAVRKNAVLPQDDKIVIDIGEGMDELLLGVGISSFLPSDITGDVGLIIVVKRSDIASQLSLARRLDDWALPLILAPLLPLAGAFFLMSDKSRFLVYAGIALAASAALWILVLKFPFKSWVVSHAVRDPDSRAAANSVYDVFVGTFMQQELLVIGAGIVIAVVGFVLASKAKAAPAA